MLIAQIKLTVSEDGRYYQASMPQGLEPGEHIFIEKTAIDDANEIMNDLINAFHQPLNKVDFFNLLKQTEAFKEKYK